MIYEFIRFLFVPKEQIKKKERTASCDGEGLIKVQATDQHKAKQQQKIIPQWKRYDKEANSISMCYDFFSFFLRFLLNLRKKKKISNHHHKYEQKVRIHNIQIQIRRHTFKLE